MKAASVIILFAAACAVATAAGRGIHLIERRVFCFYYRTLDPGTQASPQSAPNVDLTGMPKVRQHGSLNRGWPSAHNG